MDYFMEMFKFKQKIQKEIYVGNGIYFHK